MILDKMPPFSRDLDTADCCPQPQVRVGMGSLLLEFTNGRIFLALLSGDHYFNFGNCYFRNFIVAL